MPVENGTSSKGVDSKVVGQEQLPQLSDAFRQKLIAYAFSLLTEAAGGSDLQPAQLVADMRAALKSTEGEIARDGVLAAHYQQLMQNQKNVD